MESGPRVARQASRLSVSAWGRLTGSAPHTGTPGPRGGDLWPSWVGGAASPPCWVLGVRSRDQPSSRPQASLPLMGEKGSSLRPPSR